MHGGIREIEGSEWSFEGINRPSEETIRTRNVLRPANRATHLLQLK